MHSILVSFVVAGLATFAHAYTKPGANTWGPLLTPDLSQGVTQGKEFKVTWDPESHPTDGVTVSLVLCHGGSSNCVPEDTAIASGIPADQKSFNWAVPCDLAPGKQGTDTGYGMLVIVDGTGEFQYSTQFSCLENKACAGSSTTSNTTSSASPSGSVVVLPPPQQTGSSPAQGNSTTPQPTTATAGATATITSASAPNTVASGWPTEASTLPVTTLVSSATLASTLGVTGSTTSASAGVASPSTFPGAAAQVTWSIGGVVAAAAAAAALFAW